MRNRNIIRVLRDVQLFGLAPNLGSVVTWDNTLNPGSEHFLEVSEPVNEPTWVVVIPCRYYPDSEEERSMEGERKSKRINEKKQRRLEEDSAETFEDPQALDLVVLPEGSQCPNLNAASPVLEIPGQRKIIKTSTQSSMVKGAAPTLQAALRRANEENAVLKVKVKSLEEKVGLLENDKKFLQQRLSEALVMRKAASGQRPQSHVSISDSSEGEDSSSMEEDSTNSTSSSYQQKKREKEKKKRLWKKANKGECRNVVMEKKKRQKKRQLDSDTSSDTDDFPKQKKSKKRKMKEYPKKKVGMPEDVISRYRRVLKAVSIGMSKTDAYSYVGVNRKTIVDTAAIAELKQVDPESYHQIRAMFHKGRKGHTLYDFAEQCKSVFSKKPELKATVERMKEDGRLLDIHTYN
ncbi:uncharacterized protein LOC143525725 isoform X1 [Brachyhypopomus gauderio]|uniref:uncharacterized protein LOC143525725 isoform X1 n=1 Tax=Brachyhypopomus gauderio TaxID=698409 RepID=UPI0040410A3F